VQNPGSPISGSSVFPQLICNWAESRHIFTTVKLLPTIKHAMFRITFPGQAHTVSFLALLIMLISQACIWGPISLEEELVPLSSGSEERLFEGSIAMVYQRDVYVLDPYGRPPKQLTNSPLEPKTKIALSHGKDKVAYLDQSAFPVLIDSSGQELAYLTEYGPILYLGWSGDDQTLWMMGEDRKEFQYYGPDMGLPDNLNAPPSTLNALDVSSTGVVAFLIGPSIRIHSHPSGDSLVFPIDNGIQYITFSQDGNKILYSRDSQHIPLASPYFGMMDIMNNKINKYQFLSIGNLLTPILNTDGQELIYASNQKAFNTNSFYTNIRYHSFLPTSESGENWVPHGAFISFLDRSSSIIYLDWKP